MTVAQRSQAAAGVTVTVHASSQTMISDERAHGTTAIEAVRNTLNGNSIPYELGADNSFIRSINGEQNWLYSINGWTPGCTAMNEYTLSNGDDLTVYALNHQYTTLTQLSTTSAPTVQGDTWTLAAHTREPSRSQQCDRPRNESEWSGASLPVQIVRPDGSRISKEAISDTLTFEVDQEGWYSAQVFSDGYMPSKIVRVYVAKGSVPSNSSKEQHEAKPLQEQVVERQPFAKHGDGSGATNNKSKAGATVQNLAGGSSLLAATHATPGTRGAVQEQVVRHGTSFVNNEAHRAALYLLQNKDGQGLIGGPSLNSWALLGLVAAYGVESDEAQSMLQAHRAHLETVDDLSPLEVAKQLMLAKAFDENPRNFAGINIEERLIRYHDGTQFGEVGALNDDIWALVALIVAGRDGGDALVKSTAQYILDRQNEDGGFGHAVDGQSDTDDTAAAIMALSMAGTEPGHSSIQSAFQYIGANIDSDHMLARHTQDTQELSTASTAWALQAYRMTGVAAPADIAFGLQRLQQEDGSVTVGSQESRVMATALATTVLANKDIVATSQLGPLNVQHEKLANSEEQDSQIASTVSSEAQNQEPERQAREQAPSATEQSTMNELQYTIQQQKDQIVLWRRMNIILIVSIVAMGVGILVYGLLFHTNIGRAYRFDFEQID